MQAGVDEEAGDHYVVVGRVVVHFNRAIDAVNCLRRNYGSVV